MWQSSAIELRTVFGTPFTRRAVRELVAALATVPVAVFGFVVVVPAVVLGVLVIPVSGFGLLAAVVQGVRRTAAVDRGLVRKLLRHTVPGPAPLPATGSAMAWIGSRVRDGAGWRAVGYRVLAVLVLPVTAVLPVLCWGAALLLTTSPLWSWALPVPAGQQVLPVLDLPVVFTGDGDQLLRWALGVALLFCAPWVTRLSVGVVPLLVGALLGRPALARRVAELEAGRAVLVDDAAARLRRIERDLHDGTQAQLVALAMRLGMAKEALDAEPADVEQARTLVRTAHQGAKQALVELRDLARGIAPPVLASGLDAAIGTLAARCPLPVDLDVRVQPRPAAAVESTAYFCVAELLTNAVKHSGADRVAVTVHRRADTLLVLVRDTGTGGAHASPGGGLRGLTDRVGAVDGTLTVSSPVAGPTVITVELPCGS